MQRNTLRQRKTWLHTSKPPLRMATTSLIAAVLGDIARAKGMSQIARDTGLGRESLYKALSPDGNPEFATILKVVRALGLKLHASSTVDS